MIGRDSENQKKSFSLKGVIFIKKPFRNIREENRAYYSTPLRLNDFFWSSKSPPIILLRQFETITLLSLVSKLKIARTEGLRLLRLQTASRVLWVRTCKFLTVFQECKTDPTVSFINRPLQTIYRRNGVHEFVLGPKLSIGDLGLAQIPNETEFLILDLEKVNRRNR